MSRFYLTSRVSQAQSGEGSIFHLPIHRSGSYRSPAGTDRINHENRTDNVLCYISTVLLCDRLMQLLNFYVMMNRFTDPLPKNAPIDLTDFAEIYCCDIPFL